MTLGSSTGVTPWRPIEAVLAKHTVRRAVYVGPLVILGSWALGGMSWALAAAIGVGIVAFDFWTAGLFMSAAMRISLDMYHVIAVLGFVLRMGLVAVSMLLVVRVFPIDRLVFGVSAVLTYLALLGLEVLAVTRGREKELEWGI